MVGRVLLHHESLGLDTPSVSCMQHVDIHISSLDIYLPYVQYSFCSFESSVLNQILVIY